MDSALSTVGLPIARVLLKKREGDTVLLRKPAGEVELTVVSVRY